MEYEKKIMTISELIPYGFTKKELYGIARKRNNGVAYKVGKGGTTSTYKFDTDKLDKYLKSKSTGI